MVAEAGLPWLDDPSVDEVGATVNDCVDCELVSSADDVREVSCEEV